MTPQKDYRNRAAHVRRSARAQLKEIRRARLARKESDAAPLPVDDIDQTHEEAADAMPCPFDQPAAPAVSDANVDLGANETEPPTSDTQMSEVADSIEDTALAELDDMFDDAASASTPDVVAEEVVEEPTLEVSDGVDLLAEEEPAAEPEIELTADCSDQSGAVAQQEEAETYNPVSAEAKPDLEGSDLNSLPGAGPGLVWMLHQCGVSSLAELAESDPDELTPKLGVVGQILDVSKWIDFATVETAAPH